MQDSKKSMKVGERHLRVKSFAKVNLDLRVLWRRADGFHEIRTLFHTISLADHIGLQWRPGRRLSLATECAGLNLPMEENLAHRAAVAVCEEANLRGELQITIEKHIPTGGGLGGGSSNAAAILLALPAFTGARIPALRLLEMAARLGSDVPFFLMGGAAIGLGRGEELYPAPDFPALEGILAAPGVFVSTPDAYRALRRPQLEKPFESPAFATLVREFSRSFLNPKSIASEWDGTLLGQNDFESVVFAEHPQLASWKRRFREVGALHAMMSGSGSTVFGLFANRESAKRAHQQCKSLPIHSFRLLSRSRYQREWLRSLSPYSHTEIWPPQSNSTSIPSHV